MVDMKWMGDKVLNFGTRVRNGTKYVPIVIVNHISMGTLGSMGAWFRNPASRVSSHFGLGRDGEVHQYVRLENEAWTQGLTSETIPKAPAPIVRQMGVNPNLYCISIEHEGYAENGQDGSLTEEQFWTLCWLHKYIQHEVERIWGSHIQFGPHTVIGHFQIDPIRKPNCPGPAFPWARFYAELAIAEDMTFEDYEERIDFQSGQASKFAAAYAVAERIRDLGEKLNGKWAANAERLLMVLEPILPAIGYTEYSITPDGIIKRVKSIYDTSQVEGRWQLEAVRKLMLLEPIMKEKGLL